MKEDEAKSDDFELIPEGKKKKPKEIYLQRIVNSETFAEAVFIENIPKFLIANNGTGEISVVDSVKLEKEGKIAYPLAAESYINKPYTFNSKLEFEAILGEARKQTLDSLYRMVKPIWKKYVDANDSHISICAADTIFTYFQDKAGMTHYLFFVGGPGSGKSNNLEVFHFLAYRNLTSVGITPATLYRFYGSREEGVGTICEDEANTLDEKDNENKLTFYKNGYTKGKPVVRNEDTDKGKTPTRFFTFSWKALAAERLPDSVTAKGFLERTMPIPCSYGYPEYDITEVANPMGDQKFIQLLQELEKTRNLLLVYRILHYHDNFEDIPLNITGREKQLFKPTLRLFNGTDTQKELEDVISSFINERRAANVDSQHAFIYRIVVALITQKDSYELASTDIWDTVTNSAEGEFMYKGKTKFETVDYGVLTQKLVVKICKEVLGAKPRSDGSKRKLVFSKDRLDRLNDLYNLDLEVKMTGLTGFTHFTHSEGVGMDAYNQNTPSKEDNSQESPEDNEEITRKIEVEASTDVPKHSQNPSNESNPSNDNNDTTKIKPPSRPSAYSNSNSSSSSESKE